MFLIFIYFNNRNILHNIIFWTALPVTDTINDAKMWIMDLLHENKERRLGYTRPQEILSHMYFTGKNIIISFKYL
jgi:hypothetical protein